MSIYDDSLKKHYEWRGKIETLTRVDVSNKEQLSLAYTPGVAQACLEIEKDLDKSFLLTRRWNTVAIITDGSAVLGLGNIGPEAGMPVMEGKALLFKTFGNVDAIPLCLKTNDVNELVKTIYYLSGSFGGINLEDISAPRCFEIEEKLNQLCNIPVFHDDQHGTAIVVGAALLNALKIVEKDITTIKCVINGCGAAGIAITKFLKSLGVEDIICCDRQGIIYQGMDQLNMAQQEITKITNLQHQKGLLKDAMQKADVFIGVSGPKVVNAEMIKSMNKDAIVFPLANPIPEITRDEAILGGARIIGTGSSSYPNQINNALVFPGLFRGVLDARATKVTEGMMKAASYALATLVTDEKLNENYILPFVYDMNAHQVVAEAVKLQAIKEKVVRK